MSPTRLCITLVGSLLALLLSPQASAARRGKAAQTKARQWITLQGGGGSVGMWIDSSHYESIQTRYQDGATAIGATGRFEWMVPTNFGKPKSLGWFYLGVAAGHERYRDSWSIWSRPGAEQVTQDHVVMAGRHTYIGALVGAAGPKSSFTFELGPAVGRLDANRAGTEQAAWDGRGATESSNVTHCRHRFGLSRRFAVKSPLRPVLGTFVSGSTTGASITNAKAAPLISTNGWWGGYEMVGIEVGVALGVR